VILEDTQFRCDDDFTYCFYCGWHPIDCVCQPLLDWGDDLEQALC
jgi:hypothetical protein